MSRILAVLISDIHFTPQTLELASSALLRAQSKACALNVPLIIAGDTLDSKSIIRAECANRLLSILKGSPVPTYMIVGNHDLCNEKGTEHALNFLKGVCEIVDRPTPITFYGLDAMLLPYYSDVSKLKVILENPATPRTLIMHQGVQTAFMGHYLQDKSSLPKEAFADFRVISGHYHRRQDIKTGRPRKGSVGLFSYIGNPYTLTFGEANDPEKGFQMLMDDGTLEFVPTNLRRHVVLETNIDSWREVGTQRSEDLVWLKITGESSELAKLTKADVANVLGVTNFKLDKIPYDAEQPTKSQVKEQTESELLDSLIDNLGETSDQKQYLKTLYRKVMS